MAKTDIGKMTYAQLSVMEQRITRAKIEKQDEERAALKFDISDLFGRRAKLRGAVAPKYRDPANPQNTWTGRGRMPRWMTQATKGGKAKKEDFLIK
jgi:DNA-binding protein H-NS